MLPARQETLWPHENIFQKTTVADPAPSSMETTMELMAGL